MIAVWVSCGAASAAAAALTLEQFDSVVLVNNPIVQEDEDNRRFVEDLSRVLGVPILSAVNPDYPTGDCVQVWNDERFMANKQGACCTRLLKRKARHVWEDQNPTTGMVLGFSFDECERAERFKRFERSSLIPVLINAKMNKQACAEFVVRKLGIPLPRVYAMGFPNANCIGCVKATSATYWNHVRRLFPSVFAERAEQSRALGVKLARYKGRRLFLDELPASAYGAPMKTLRPVGCDLFCEL